MFRKYAAPTHIVHVSQKMLSPSSPALNPLDYYLWVVVVRVTNQRPTHSTKDSLNTIMLDLMANIKYNHLNRAYNHFCNVATFEAELVILSNLFLLNIC